MFECCVWSGVDVFLEELGDEITHFGVASESADGRGPIGRFVKIKVLGGNTKPNPENDGRVVRGRERG